MKIIMMGTGQYALPTLQALYTTPHEIVALFTRPERSPRHRRPPAGPALPQLAQAHGTPVYDPPDVNAPKVQQILRNLAPDLLVVCDYGQRLAGETLSLARWGGFNLHASLLPKYRGAAPVNWALYHGETHTGNTVIHMTPQIDGGPCVAQQPVAIDPEETAVQLEARLATAGASLVLTAIDQLQADALEEVPQDPHEVTRAPKLKKTDGRVH
ncbi:MAG: methionyl-tRNA formyltransferase, partial [Planctomycetales bacterium]|nr:methionyl-tRNA formyltransferase [Planctomycetales bacterium]